MLRIEGAGKVYVDIEEPRATAQQFLDTVRDDAASPLRVLRHHQSQWLAWNGRHYAAVEETVVYALLDRWMAANDCDPKNGPKANVRDALQLLTQTIGGAEYGHWLDGRGGEWLSFENVLLNLDTLQTVPHSPEFLNLFSLPFGYDKGAKCPGWLKFLGDVYEGDAQSIEALQRVFGGNVLPQKILQQAIILLLGERRGGKGTIGRVLRAMLGGDAVVGADLHTLGGNFGAEHLIGKRVALGEARAASVRGSTQTTWRRWSACCRSPEKTR